MIIGLRTDLSMMSRRILGYPGAQGLKREGREKGKEIKIHHKFHLLEE